MNTSLIITKPKFDKNISRIRAVSLKPASFVDEPSPTFFIVYVTEGGQELRNQCTKEAFLRVNGEPDTNIIQGLDLDIKKDFLLLHDTKKDLIVGVHTIPKNSYLRGLYPMDMEGRKHMQISVLHTGELDVTQLPPKMPKALVSSILASVDELSEIKPGDKLQGRHTVTGASGNQLQIEPEIKRRR